MLNTPQGIKKMTRKIKLSIAPHGGFFVSRRLINQISSEEIHLHYSKYSYTLGMKLQSEILTSLI